MAAATLLPPLRPIATMAGTSCFSQTEKSRSLLSTTFTKPTGTPMTSAGRRPLSICSAIVSRAVGALPTARMAPGCSCAAAQLRQTGFGDAGQRHVCIGHDDGPGVEGLDGLLHRAGSEVEIPRIVEVGGGVDDPLDHGFVLGRRGQAHHFQLFGDDVEARPLNVSR